MVAEPIPQFQYGPNGVTVFRQWWACSHCMGEVKPTFRFCPHCGQKFKEVPRGHS
jgi:predicted amidophosphoribosyltransferase